MFARCLYRFGPPYLYSSPGVPYSFYNVSSYYANRTFSLIFQTAATTTTISVTLPEGFYTVTDINSYIQQICIDYGAYLICLLLLQLLLQL